ncbi:MAG: roadblock/LC7 domain-containing protein [Halobacteriota archaeon]|nr:roadblock/LC7 domain-containing protein [Halobacteriota archaeon]
MTDLKEKDWVFLDTISEGVGIPLERISQILDFLEDFKFIKFNPEKGTIGIDDFGLGSLSLPISGERETWTKGLEQVLKSLEDIGGTEASALISRDGFLICFKNFVGVNEDLFGQAAVSIFNAGKMVTNELKGMEPASIVIEMKNGKIIVMGVGSEAFLVLSLSSEASLAIAMTIMRNSLEKLKKILKV